MLDKVVIIDFGTRFSQSIARKVREHHIYSEIVSADTAVPEIKALAPNGIIVCGNEHQDVNQSFVLKEDLLTINVPVLGIGHGLENCNFPILTNYDSHALRSFLVAQCKCEQNWNAATYASHLIESIRKQVGNERVICGLSGGLDSSVAAVLVHRAVGDQLTCIFVDHGFMRKNEAEQVVTTFKNKFNINLVHVDASQRFLGKLEDVSDPEQKRKIIGNEFINVFQDEATKIGDAKFLVQGTLYSDVIESMTSQGKVIKSHHNVGGLPEDLQFELVEPLRTLFKDEVRELAKYLGLPEEIVWRHPFPGPGLAIRIIGEITKERLDILREADAIYLDEIRQAGLYRDIWQAFAVLTNTQTVGVTNNQRTYEYVLALRAVVSDDAMSADWVRIPYEVLAKISNRIIREVPGVNRVVYDISSKPPATIEWE